MVQTWSDVLTTSLQGLWTGTISFLPKILGALILFLLGWIVANALGKLVSQVIKAVKLDKALQSLGTEEQLSKAGIKLDSGALLGAVVKWFLIIVFLVAALDVLELSQVNVFLSGVVAYLPNVFVAALILVAGTLLAEFLYRLVSGSAKVAGISSASFLGAVVKWAIWVFALLAALYQLGIAFGQTLFVGFVAMVAIAGGLAFGLGGKEAASRFLEKLADDMSKK